MDLSESKVTLISSGGSSGDSQRVPLPQTLPCTWLGKFEAWPWSSVHKWYSLELHSWLFVSLQLWGQQKLGVLEWQLSGSAQTYAYGRGTKLTMCRGFTSQAFSAPSKSKPWQQPGTLTCVDRGLLDDNISSEPDSGYMGKLFFNIVGAGERQNPANRYNLWAADGEGHYVHLFSCTV